MLLSQGGFLVVVTGGYLVLGTRRFEVVINEGF